MVSKTNKMKKCLNCGKEFVEYREGKSNAKKYCSMDCQITFNDKKAYLSGTKFAKIHKKEYNAHLLRNYYNDKGKWQSRAITYKVMKQISNIEKILPSKCKKCNSIIKLEIHHEIYPLRFGEIIDAILENKIYFLCLKCHSELHRKIY